MMTDQGAANAASSWQQERWSEPRAGPATVAAFKVTQDETGWPVPHRRFFVTRLRGSRQLSEQRTHLSRCAAHCVGAADVDPDAAPPSRCAGASRWGDRS